METKIELREYNEQESKIKKIILKRNTRTQLNRIAKHKCMSYDELIDYMIDEIRVKIETANILKQLKK